MNMSRNTVSLCEKNRGYLGNCRSVLQEIVWMIDNWDSSIRMYQVTRKEEEITNCENALMKLKEMIWTSCLTMFSKYNHQTKQRRGSQGALMYNQPELTGSRKVSRNTEVLVHENNAIPVAVRQREETHTMVVSNSPHQQVVKNLLFDWSIFINSNFQLCLVGNMPNCGTWETSAVSVRLGPATVKTVGGTIYNINGKMVVQDEDIPDFVQQKFHAGFPVDWKAVASKWISVLKKETCGHSGPRIPDENAQLEPCVVMNDIRKMVAVAPSQAQQKNKMLVPSPREVARSRTSTLVSRGSPFLRHAQNHQDESSSEEEEMEERNAAKNVNSVLPRYSKRLLSKSLLDTTNLSEGEVSVKKKTNENKFKYIKNWTVDFFKQEKLILCGTLIDEKGSTLEECHNSAAIAHRVHADVIETEKGHLYRLVGPSASTSKHFDFGFPVHWQKLKAPSQPPKKALMAPNPKRSRNTSQSSVASMEVKRHTSMVNQTIKHQLTRVQSSMAEVINNGVLNNRNANKRADDSRNAAPTKRRKVSNADSGQAGMKQSDSVANTSVGETQWKRDLLKRMQGKEIVKVGVRKTGAVELSSQGKASESEVSVKPKGAKPVRRNFSDEKYGHATDGCQSENEFNIF